MELPDIVVVQSGGTFGIDSGGSRKEMSTLSDQINDNHDRVKAV